MPTSYSPPYYSERCGQPCDYGFCSHRDYLSRFKKCQCDTFPMHSHGSQGEVQGGQRDVMLSDFGSNCPNRKKISDQRLLDESRMENQTLDNKHTSGKKSTVAGLFAIFSGVFYFKSDSCFIWTQIQYLLHSMWLTNWGSNLWSVCDKLMAIGRKSHETRCLSCTICATHINYTLNNATCYGELLFLF